jgi:preprotein translocase subunit SecF
MATRFQKFGNDLYTGARSLDFVGKRRIWYSIAIALIVASVLIPILKGGFSFSIDFTGGSQFTVSDVKTSDQNLATDAVHRVKPGASVQVTSTEGTGGKGIQVQTDQLSTDQTTSVSEGLASAYEVSQDNVASSFIGPSWGADVSRQAIQGLVVFLLLAFIAMAFYFRTWKMSAAAIVSLFHDLIITAGVYALFGIQISPATMIGFLTILGYSLYDTVVVFDKIRENTRNDNEALSHTFTESVNLAVNQTLVRSINTAVVAVLPVAAILFIGSFVFGAQTLEDISLALFIGILIGTYSTIFVAAPLYSDFRRGEAAIVKHDRKVLGARAKAPTTTVVAE